MSLDRATTDQVVYNCHSSLHTGTTDVLAASLFLAFLQAFPDRAEQLPAIFVEGHGRGQAGGDDDDDDNGVDVSRTVGWFTTLYPLYSTTAAGTRDDIILSLVRHAKDMRTRMKFTNGFQNMMPAEVLFNYEGRYQYLERQDALLAPESWTAGEALADMSPRLQRFSLFEIAAVLRGGQLQFTFSWNRNMRHQARIAALVARFPETVARVAGALGRAQAQLTLSDVSRMDDDMGYSYAQLKEITDAVLYDVKDIQDVYPCSPMQQSLAFSQSRSEDIYEVEMTWKVTAGTLAGNKVDPECLEAAWYETVACHAALRTFMVESKTTSHMLDQVVLKKHVVHSPAVRAFLCQRLHAADAADALRLLADHQYTPKPKGFLLGRPLHRLVIVSTDNDVFCRLEINHIVFDGMSVLPLLRGISCAYKNKNKTTKVEQSTCAKFVRYIRHQPRRAKSISYWTTYLAGVEPCMFPRLVDNSSGPVGGIDKNGPRQVRVPLDTPPAEIQAVLAQLGLTLPTLFKMVWSLVLRLYTGRSQAMFGYVASGREAPVAGIEDAVGLFIAQLVCFVDLGAASGSTGRRLVDFMKRVQQDSLDGSEHQAACISDIQSALGRGGDFGGALFNTSVSFVPLMTAAAQGSDSALVFEQLAVQDPTEVCIVVEDYCTSKTQ